MWRGAPYFSERFAGEPVKGPLYTPGVLPRRGRGQRQKGEFNITATGIEGGLIYALSAPLRDALARDGRAALTLDLAPGRSLEKLTAELSRPRGRDSLANHLRRRAGIEGVKAALLREFCPAGNLECRMHQSGCGDQGLPLTGDRHPAD